MVNALYKTFCSLYSFLVGKIEEIFLKKKFLVIITRLIL